MIRTPPFSADRAFVPALVVITIAFMRTESRASDTQLVDAGLLGGAGNSYATDQSISDDGRYVAFVSGANNLVPGTLGNWNRVYVRDMVTGATILASKTSTGALPNVDSLFARISGDSRFVVFLTSAALTPNDQNGAQDVYIFDRISNSIECVSVDANGVPASGQLLVEGTYTPRNVVSGDGRYVAFSSFAQLVSSDLGQQRDCYVRDRALNQTILVSTTSAGISGNGDSLTGAISANGKVIVFKTLANDLTGTSSAGIYAKHMQTGATERVDVLANGTPMTGPVSAGLALSADGLHVALEVDGSNVALGDTDLDTDIYVVDLDTHLVQLVSAPMDGSFSTGRSIGPSLSTGGRYVTFESTASNIVPWDVNPSSAFGGSDVFLRDRLTQRNVLINVSNSMAQSTSGFAATASMSADGRTIAFISSQSLVSGVTSSFYNVYRRNRIGFANLGFGIAGTSGIPALTGSGSPSAGGVGAMQLGLAAPNSTSLLLLSLSHGLTAPSGGPLKSSVLVTSAPIVVVTVPTDPAGGWTLPFAFAPGMTLVPELYAQCAVIDSAAVKGVSLSNALNLGFE